MDKTLQEIAEMEQLLKDLNVFVCFIEAQNIDFNNFNILRLASRVPTIIDTFKHNEALKKAFTKENFDKLKKYQ